MAPPKITLAALGGAAAALAHQRLRRKWLALPYAWRRSATRTELMRWILFDAAPEWATTERMHALRRAVACPAQSVSYANADPLLIVGGQGARLVDVRGRRFLDTRNNVAHVGHAHPRVARAVAAAMTAPCTNTRYLHPNHAALCSVEINQCVGCTGFVERRGTGIATPSSKRRVDGVEVDATIQNERAVNFDFHTVHDVVQVHEAVAISIARIKSVPQYGVVVLINRFST